jgi:hypothetical protein
MHSSGASKEETQGPQKEIERPTAQHEKTFLCWTRRSTTPWTIRIVKDAIFTRRNANERITKGTMNKDIYFTSEQKDTRFRLALLVLEISPGL